MEGFGEQKNAASEVVVVTYFADLHVMLVVGPCDRPWLEY